jgi:hypothetical protein
MELSLRSYIPNGHHLSKVDHQTSKALRVVAQWHDIWKNGIQHSFTTPTFQPRHLDKQLRPFHADRWGMDYSVDRSPTDHVPIATLRTPVTRTRSGHPQMKYSVLSPTLLMFAA